MKRVIDSYRDYWRQYPGLFFIFHIVSLLVILFIAGAGLAAQGKVSAAIPFVLIFIAIGLLAFVNKPRKW